MTTDPYIWNTSSYARAITVGAVGTSFAGSFASGVAALAIESSLKNRGKKLTVSQLRNILLKSADDLVGPATFDKLGNDIYYGKGRVNAFKAIQEAKK